MIYSKKSKGITLIALVVTIIVLIIISGVSISLILGNNGIINKAQEASINHQLAANLEQAKIDELYGQLKVATDGTVTLDMTTLNELMERKINDALSPGGIIESKINDEINTHANSSNSENTTINRSEYESILSRLDNLENQTNTSESIGTFYSQSFSNVSITKEKSNILKGITLPAGKYVLIGFASYEGSDLRYHITLGGASSSAYDKNGYVRMNVADIVTPNVETTYNLYLYVHDKNITIANGYIKAIKIAD